MLLRCREILVTGLMALLAMGCGGESSAPIMVESDHSHYHVHGVDASHEHSHGDDTVGGHAHSHRHSEKRDDEGESK
jgi:hypothetical protein